MHEVTWLEDFLTSFTALQAFAPDDLPHDLSDLEMTWLPYVLAPPLNLTAFNHHQLKAPQVGRTTTEWTSLKYSYFSINV